MVGGWSTRLSRAALTALLAPVTVVTAGFLAAAAGVGDVPGRAAAVGAGAVVALVLLPAYRPEPVRPLDRGKRIAAGVATSTGLLGLAGYAGVPAVPAPGTLFVAAVLLAVVLPAAYAAVRRLDGSGETVVVVGDDGAKIESVAATLGARSCGYCAPPSTGLSGGDPATTAATDPDRLQPDGGAVVTSSEPERIAGLSQLERVLAERDVREVALAFSESDRQEFFGALRVCHAHGVAASVHPSHAAAVLAAGERTDGSDEGFGSERAVDADRSDAGTIEATDGGDVLDAAADGPRASAAAEKRRADARSRGDAVDAVAGASEPRATAAGEPRPAAADGEPTDRTGDGLVAVDVEPWPWYSRLCKRAFDVAFAVAGLVALSPLMAVIALAIKLDSPGPVLYGQTRTAELGGTFQLYKFRSMAAGPGAEEVPDPSEGKEVDRITRVGRVLRTTHLDEIPQLFSILSGDMSVVGPRAVWVEEERYLVSEVEEWQKRWSVKPGLTGLAQVAGASSAEPAEKFEHDLAYVRGRSMGTDLYVVSKQIWLVLADVAVLLRSKLH